MSLRVCLGDGFAFASIARCTSFAQPLGRSPFGNSFCVQRAITPATCGAAMLVPLLLTRPPPNCAERIETPGAASRQSVLEKSATLPVCVTAPTGRKPSAAAGGATATVKRASCCLRLSLPEAATNRAPRPRATRASTSAASRSNRRTFDRYVP